LGILHRGRGCCQKKVTDQSPFFLRKKLLEGKKDWRKIDSKEHVVNHFFNNNILKPDAPFIYHNFDFFINTNYRRHLAKAIMQDLFDGLKICFYYQFRIHTQIIFKF
jgi:hypothetical protein